MAFREFQTFCKLDRTLCCARLAGQLEEHVKRFAAPPTILAGHLAFLRMEVR